MMTKLSVIIPSRNEQFLPETVNDLFAKAAGDIEVIVVVEKRRDEIEEHVTNLEADWTDDELAYSFSTFGFNINGNLVVDEGCAKVAANVPLPALMFRGRIEKLIQDELGKLLAPEPAS